MRGLLLKDFYLMRAGAAAMIVTFIIVGVGITFLIDPWLVSLISSVIFGMLSASTIGVDKQCGWNKLAATLPVSRATVIDSKFLAYLLCSAVGFGLGVVLCLVIATVRPELLTSPEMIRIQLSLAAAMAVFGGALIIPSGFLLSVEKSLISSMVTYPIIAGIFIAVASLTDDRILACNILLAVSVIVFAASWLASRKLIAKRDIH